MDWSKAKNILIIAFIITNIFLFYNVYKNMNENNFFYINDETVEDVKKILEERNIFIETEVPKKVPSLPILKVKYETYDGDELAKKILGDYQKIDDKYFDADRNERIEVSHNNKFFIYERKLMTSNINKISLEEAKKFADKFIEDYGFNDGSVKYSDTIVKDNGEYEVIYKQSYNGMFLEDLGDVKDEEMLTRLEIRVTVNNTGIIKFTKKWIVPDGTKSHAKRVIPSTKALLMAIEDINNVNDNKAIITDISLGYILDVPNFDTLINDEWYEMESTYASPYWRICLKNKKRIYIQAYE